MDLHYNGGFLPDILMLTQSPIYCCMVRCHYYRISLAPTTPFNYVLHCFLSYFVSFSYMAINVSKCTVQRWASPRHYTVDPMLLPSGNPFTCHEEVLSLQPLSQPKHFDIFPPDWECSEALYAFRCFFKH